MMRSLTLALIGTCLLGAPIASAQTVRVSADETGRELQLGTSVWLRENGRHQRSFMARYERDLSSELGLSFESDLAMRSNERFGSVDERFGTVAVLLRAQDPGHYLGRFFSLGVARAFPGSGSPTAPRGMAYVVGTGIHPPTLGQFGLHFEVQLLRFSNDVIVVRGLGGVRYRFH